MANTPLTEDEAAFISRMADHLIANPGMSIEDVARAVLARDMELFIVATGRTKEGETIRDTMMSETYRRARLPD